MWRSRRRLQLPAQMGSMARTFATSGLQARQAHATRGELRRADVWLGPELAVVAIE